MSSAVSASPCPGCIPATQASEEVAKKIKANLRFSVPSVHCAACIAKIEQGLQAVPGVRDARVNLSLKRLSVQADDTVGEAQIAEHLAGLGFAAYPLDQEALGNDTDPEGRALLLRLAVAGFAMMNVMLLSVAVWSGATDATRDLFHLISATIAVPVVAFSGQPFFKSAWSALRHRRLNMDVPISLAIVLAVGMSIFEARQSGAHAYFDAALSLTFFLLIGKFLEHKTRGAARSAARELSALEVHRASVMIDGQAETRAVSELAVGDHILVPSGMRVPVDGDLLSVTAQMDRSFLTGESDEVEVQAGAALQAGEVNLGAPLSLRATAVGEDTTLRRVAAMVELAETGRNSYTSLAAKAAQIYAPAVHLLALLAFLGWLVASHDVRMSLNIAVAVLIITCPCALGLAVPAVSTGAIGRLFSAGLLVRHATALERLAEVDLAVFDKTGTLTRPGFDVATSGLSAVEQAILLGLAQASDHPVSKAIAETLGAQMKPAPLERIEEIKGAGVQAYFGGDRVQLGRADWLGAEFSGTGLRIGSSQARKVETTETLRDGAKSAVATLQKAGIPVHILTGDRREAAVDIAHQLGVLDIQAGVRAEEKLARLKDLEERGYKVLMVGDGLNDTAALAGAHASMAPSTALDASRNAADIVILRQDLASIPLALAVARSTVKLSRQNFAIAAGYNLIAIPIALAGFATPLLAALAMSASSLTVLANAMRVRLVK
ncbi:heavy metal translocating P-type ATPase [Neptunicoccus cionae]|uniref:Copper-translocating P-type ATPase n=1 Tax=Neptunicoccus cionae TaxID=2035344 RepID=A0A916QYX1_9RHOB|nr:heavy metal translocating P-type ATPase [Amylibacter cionae]GGA15337.1 copper-translocating P-type ATPase [Amylibacter cionae]